ncbi:MAG: TonB-dependent receptor plug domain-containing protein, partial [Alphaproteobacteria bacterium]|nr:TonB-dependent receptor plug domain-containing protein [Alphaproteobacteria bacterium]
MRTGLSMKTFWASLAVAVLLVMTGAAEAGPLAPQPRVVAKYERDFIERSGAQTLQELLDTGIIRYFLTGGQNLLVLVNGRPYASTAGDLDPLPLSAVERIEVLGPDSLGTLGGATVRGALNIVLRTDLDGFETRTVARAPSREGGDGWQGSVFWGGVVGRGGRMTLGVDMLDRQEIPGRAREHSRSEWVEGGSFSDAKNVSLSGNTVYVVQGQPDPNAPGGFDVTGLRSVALGDCDPAQGYTGPLSNPPGIRNGDEGCGFAFGNIWWDTPSFEQQSAILNLDHPLGGDAELHLDVNLTQSDSAFRYAPSVDVFTFTPDSDLLAAINEAAGEADPSFAADTNDLFAVGHRFVAHGNRDWVTDSEEYDLSLGVTGRLAEGLGYDARLDAWRWDSAVTGNTLVHGKTIQDAVQAGHYDLADPFSQDANHLQAITDSSLRQERDSGAEVLSARFALEGSGFALGGRDAAWTAGVELGRVEAHSLLRFRHVGGKHEGEIRDVREVLGSGGVSYAGDRNTSAAFAEISLPLADRLDLRVAGRGVEYDDVGGLGYWRVGGEYRPPRIIARRGSGGPGEGAPAMA